MSGFVAARAARADIGGSRHRDRESVLETTRATFATQTRVTRGLDQVVDVETPEQVVFTYTVAGIGSRAAAALVDYGVIIGVSLLLVAVYLFLLPSYLHVSNASMLIRRAGGWAAAVLLLLLFVEQWGYYVLFEAFADGQTPGKRWLGLRVVRDGGYSITFASSAARNVARVLDQQPILLYIVGLVAVAVSKTGKRLGDHLAGTLVVRERLLRVPVEPLTAEGGRGASLTTTLTDEELELLDRFLERVGGLDAAHRDALSDQFAVRFRAHLPPTGDLLTGLRALRDAELGARGSGVSARGVTGAARERYALIAEGEARWSRFASTVEEARRRGLGHMSGDEVAEFVGAYREIATDLARLSTAARDREIDARFRLSRLVAAGHNLLYRRDRAAPRAIRHFLFVAIPGELRRSALPILGAAFLFFGSAAASWISVVRDPELVQELLPAGMIDRAEVDAARARSGDARYIDVEDYTRPIVASTVIRNNVQVTFFAFASGLTAGVLTVWILLMNGIGIGSAIGLFQSKGIARLILDFVVAHSVFELSAICIAAGAGFIIAGAILLPGARTRREALVLEGRRSLRLLAGATMLLLFAGAIEGLISPRADLGSGFKVGVAVTCVLLLALYVSLGRNLPATDGDTEPATGTSEP